jgi:hypothetical protein
MLDTQFRLIFDSKLIYETPILHTAQSILQIEATVPLANNIIIYTYKKMDVCVYMCVCVCVSGHSSGTPGAISTKLGMHIAI